MCDQSYLDSSDVTLSEPASYKVNRILSYNTDGHTPPLNYVLWHSTETNNFIINCFDILYLVLNCLFIYIKVFFGLSTMCCHIQFAQCDTLLAITIVIIFLMHKDMITTSLHTLNDGPKPFPSPAVQW